MKPYQSCESCPKIWSEKCQRCPTNQAELKSYRERTEVKFERMAKVIWHPRCKLPMQEKLCGSIPQPIVNMVGEVFLVVNDTNAAMVFPTNRASTPFFKNHNPHLQCALAAPIHNNITVIQRLSFGLCGHEDAGIGITYPRSVGICSQLLIPEC